MSMERYIRKLERQRRCVAVGTGNGDYTNMQDAIEYAQAMGAAAASRWAILRYPSAIDDANSPVPAGIDIIDVTSVSRISGRAPCAEAPALPRLLPAGGLICFRTDDGNKTWLQTGTGVWASITPDKYFRDNGIPLSHCVNADPWMEPAAAMTKENYKRLFWQGNEIVSHSYTHGIPTRISAASVVRELLGNREWLEDNTCPGEYLLLTATDYTNGGGFHLHVAAADGTVHHTAELAWNITNANLVTAINALLAAAGYTGVTAATNWMELAAQYQTEFTLSGYGNTAIPAITATTACRFRFCFADILATPYVQIVLQVVGADGATYTSSVIPNTATAGDIDTALTALLVAAGYPDAEVTVTADASDFICYVTNANYITSSLFSGYGWVEVPGEPGIPEDFDLTRYGVTITPSGTLAPEGNKAGITVRGFVEPGNALPTSPFDFRVDHAWKLDTWWARAVRRYYEYSQAYFGATAGGVIGDPHPQRHFGTIVGITEETIGNEAAAIAWLRRMCANGRRITILVHDPHAANVKDKLKYLVDAIVTIRNDRTTYKGWMVHPIRLRDYCTGIQVPAYFDADGELMQPRGAIYHDWEGDEYVVDAVPPTSTTWFEPHSTVRVRSGVAGANGKCLEIPQGVPIAVFHRKPPGQYHIRFRAKAVGTEMYLRHICKDGSGTDYNISRTYNNYYEPVTAVADTWRWYHYNFTVPDWGNGYGYIGIMARGGALYVDEVEIP